MKKSTLQQEIASLRKEVIQLREYKEKTQDQPKHSHKKSQEKQTDTIILDDNIKKSLTDFLVQAKKDYENLSPATTLFLFALGALFGRVLARGKGEH